mmetsp:Transcript_5891/g.12466  ORF Transcript_5891/g.12466 Transcript_5891/m.12466 type:complete len:116 (+) Transcript_5891:44-391(+)
MAAPFWLQTRARKAVEQKPSGAGFANARVGTVRHSAARKATSATLEAWPQLHAALPFVGRSSAASRSLPLWLARSSRWEVVGACLASPAPAPKDSQPMDQADAQLAMHQAMAAKN